MSPLSAPPVALAGFPTWRLHAARPLYRMHRQARNPWWFSHAGSGRFDLPPPRGTCYVALQPLGTFVEVFREIDRVSEASVAARRVSVLHVPGAVPVADCTARAARGFGVTAAIHSSERYDLTQAWAVALASAGFHGVRYWVSHDPAQRLVGVALFGRAGATGGPVAATEPVGPDLLEAARLQFGIHVLPAPHSG